MSAAVLRQAAALMRDRADAARAGRWSTTDSGLVPDARLVVAEWEGGPRRIATCAGSLPEGNYVNATHIASWHPAVALAVADQLDAMAAVVAEAEGTPLAIVADGLAEASIVVATAYLGTAP